MKIHLSLFDKIASISSQSDLQAAKDSVADVAAARRSDPQIQALEKGENFELGRVDKNTVEEARRRAAKRGGKRNVIDLSETEDLDELVERELERLKADNTTGASDAELEAEAYRTVFQALKAKKNEDKERPLGQDEIAQIVNRPLTEPDSIEEESVQIVPLVSQKSTIGHKRIPMGDGTFRYAPNEVVLVKGKPQWVSKAVFDVLKESPGVLRGYA